MSVMFIGNPAVGKTTLVVELAKECQEASYVRVNKPSYDELIRDLYTNKLYTNRDEEEVSLFEAVATNEVPKMRSIQMSVKLQNGVNRSFEMQWLDSPGEFWKGLNENKKNKDLHSEKDQILRNFKSAKGIILILSPHQNRLDEKRMESSLERLDVSKDCFPSYSDWIGDFQNWLNFLQDHTSVNQQLIICLNKVDLIEDCDKIVSNLKIDPHNLDRRRWSRIQNYIKENFFQEVRQEIERYNAKTDGNPINVFITTKFNRLLLELPWTYLAPYMRPETRGEE